MTLLALVATTTAALVAPTSPRPLIRAPARRLAAPALAAAAEDELPASERPGNYDDPYSMALGVSVSAVLCSELVPQTSALAVSGAHLWVGRVAACSGLPLLVACFLALKSAGQQAPGTPRMHNGARSSVEFAEVKDVMKSEEEQLMKRSVEELQALLEYMEKHGEQGVAALAARRQCTPEELRTTVANQVMELAPPSPAPLPPTRQ